MLDWHVDRRLDVSAITASRLKGRRFACIQWRYPYNNLLCAYSITRNSNVVIYQLFPEPNWPNLSIKPNLSQLTSVRRTREALTWRLGVYTAADMTRTISAGRSSNELRGNLPPLKVLQHLSSSLNHCSLILEYYALHPRPLLLQIA